MNLQTITNVNFIKMEMLIVCINVSVFEVILHRMEEQLTLFVILV